MTDTGGPAPAPAVDPPPGVGAGTDPPRRRHAVTLRTKLIATTLALVLLVCGGIGIATSLYLQRYLVSQVDTRLTDFVNHQPSNLPYGPGAPPSARYSDTTLCSATQVETPPWGGRPGSDDYVIAAVSGGAVVYADVITGFNECHPLTDEQKGSLLAAISTAPSNRNVTVDLGSLGSYRINARPGATATVEVSGLSMGREMSTLSRLAWTLVIVIGAALVVASVVAFFLIRRALRPLDRVAATARTVSTVPLHRGEVDLGIRVPARDTDPRTEVGQVGSALNQMLGHVSTALERRHASEMQVRQFVADASHELRTPLAAIRGYTELARRGEADDDTVAHALARVDSESVRMSALVDDLLLLARLDAGRPLAIDEVDLTVLVIDVVSDAQAAGPDHQWRLDLPEEPVSVVGDQPRLHQVIANLLTNARTHTPPGSTVTTGLAVVGDSVEVRVSDNGPGIDKTLLTGIFDRFVRGDSSRSRGAGSTGLGLSIVRAVVTAHSGEVTAESEPGRTTFTVRLPRLSVREPAASVS